MPHLLRKDIMAEEAIAVEAVEPAVEEKPKKGKGAAFAPYDPPPPAPEPEAPKHGNIGDSIFAEVELLTKDGKMTRTQAFDEIALRSGRKSGTVAANYYRVARAKDGSSVAPRTKRAPRPVRPATGSPLSEQIAAMERELEELRLFKATVLGALK